MESQLPDFYDSLIFEAEKRGKQEYDDLIAFCNEHNLGVWDWNKMTFIPIEEFEYKPSWHSVGSYGLSTNHGFQTAPEITLVPQGTKAPNNSWQKRFILPDGY